MEPRLPSSDSDCSSSSPTTSTTVQRVDISERGEVSQDVDCSNLTSPEGAVVLKLGRDETVSSPTHTLHAIRQAMVSEGVDGRRTSTRPSEEK
jgi:hypothetical protein